MTTERPAQRPRPDRPRPRSRPKRARVPATLALLGLVVALLGGILIGYFAAGDPSPAGLVTQERPLPVVTVTVTEAPR